MGKEGHGSRHELREESDDIKNMILMSFL